jgi:hypothetical protein
MNLSKRLERLEASIITYEDDPYELLAAGKHPSQELIMARLKRSQEREETMDQKGIGGHVI